MGREPEPRRKSSQRADQLSDVLAALYYTARREYVTDLSHRAIRVLQFVALSDAPPRVDDVARFLGSAPSTASELIKRLQKKGLVTRRRSERDERVVLLALTDVGREVLSEHTSLDPVKLKTGLDALSLRDQDALIRLIGKLTDALSPIRPPPA